MLICILRIIFKKIIMFYKKISQKECMYSPFGTYIIFSGWIE